MWKKICQCKYIYPVFGHAFYLKNTYFSFFSASFASSMCRNIVSIV